MKINNIKITVTEVTSSVIRLNKCVCVCAACVCVILLFILLELFSVTSVTIASKTRQIRVFEVTGVALPLCYLCYYINIQKP